MKTTLGYSENLPGWKKYINVTAFLKDTFNGEIEELRAIDICDYIDEKNIETYIKMILSKVKIGGKFILGGTDIISISDDLLKANISRFSINNILYSDINKKAIYNLEFIASLIPKTGFKITTKKLIDKQYIISGERI